MLLPLILLGPYIKVFLCSFVTYISPNIVVVDPHKSHED